MSTDRTAVPQGTTADRLRGSVVSEDAGERLAAFATRYWEVATYALLMSVAAVLRFWQLGDRALHHDESLHAYYGHQFADQLRQVLTFGTGNTEFWKHEPFMHGPFQFIGNGFVMWIFGSGDYQSRILAATMGTALVGMPFLLRKQLGTAGALLAAFFICFSPTLLYYSRFTREDIYTAFWTFGLVIFMWRYIATKQDRYVYLASGFMAGLFLTKEVSYFFVAAFLAFMVYLIAVYLAEKIRAKSPGMTDVKYAALTVAMLFLSPFIAILWPFLKDWRAKYDIDDEMPPAADLFVALGSIAIVCYAAFPQLAMSDTWKERAGGGLSKIHGSEEVFAYTVIFLFFAISIGIGMLWRRKTWLIAAACFWVPYVLLSTTFFSNPNGFWSVLWGSLDYWISQQDVARGDQPTFYYFMTIPVYEFLPLALSAAAIIYYGIRGDRSRALIVGGAALAIIFFMVMPRGPVIFGRELSDGSKEGASLFHVYIPFGIVLILTLTLPIENFTRFLIYWLVSATLALTMASEKMPWLNVHIALPLAVLAGKFVGDIISRSDLRDDLPKVERLAPFIYAATAGALCILVFTLVGPLSPASFGAWALAAVAAICVYWAFSSYSPRTALQVALIGAVAAFGVFTVRAAVLASWGHPDNPFVGQPGDVATRDYGEVPTELLVYTQSSGDIPVIMDMIDDYARKSGRGKDLPIVVDAAEGRTWPWAWYLRDYRSVQYPEVTADFQVPQGAVLLVSSSVADSLKLPPGGYDPGLPFHHRRWFNEAYRGVFECDANGDNCRQEYGTHDFFSDLVDTQRLGYWLDFWVRRLPHPGGEPGTIDSVALFPIGAGVASLEPEGPTVRTEGNQIVIGGKGFANGELDTPSDVAFDAAGNIYVADTANNRIQKYDASGNFLAAAGGFSSDLALNQPLSLTVADDGTVFVADSWNHRIVKLDTSLKLIDEWGAGGQVSGGGDPFQLFAPRDIALSPEGNVLISDTGNHRVIEYTPDGEFVRQAGEIGAPGDGVTFTEPVGIDVADNGDVYVADYFNKRVVVLSSALEPKTTLPVPDWGSRGVNDRAYLAVLPDGRVLVTVPSPCPDAPVAPPEGTEVTCPGVTGTVLVLAEDGTQAAAYELPKEGAESVARPLGIATDGESVLVSDATGSVVRKIPLTEIAP